jgi:hypothetical protein
MSKALPASVCDCDNSLENKDASRYFQLASQPDTSDMKMGWFLMMENPRSFVHFIDLLQYFPISRLAHSPVQKPG